jgi:MoaA/NifB/PqqE/SkfB family radical SAM enzyme
MRLSILYRGALSSCNYGCNYCPFAKKVETREEHENDRLQLEKFVSRMDELNSITISILFTPWGEALIHDRYQSAIARLSNMDHVEKVAIQTNLSCKLDWINRCNRDRLGIWATYHPGEVQRERFLERCNTLSAQKIRHSVGIVGLKEHFDEIQSVRKELPAKTYLWINAYKREKDYYSESDVQLLQSIDPLFHLNNQYHPSSGRDCRAGSSVVSVDGNGDIRRCHFIPDVVSNIYSTNFTEALVQKQCSNTVCGCHIGYVHMNELNLYDTFGDGVLERIPADFFYD